MTEITARGLTVRIGGRDVLVGVDFDARPGEMVGVIGRNGAGKTTLLRVLANLLPAASGTILYSGRGAHDVGPRPLARRLAYLAQDSTIHWPLRVESLVGLGRLPHRSPYAAESAADRDAIARALAATGTAVLRDRTVGTVSAGERKRILLARALAVEADMLLADEPVAALDPLHQLTVMQTLRDTLRLGRGVVVVLHDLSLAGRFCDRLVLLSNAAVLAEGAPPDVLRHSHLAAAFGVEMARGERDGVPYFVPWTPLRGADHGG